MGRVPSHFYFKPPRSESFLIPTDVCSAIASRWLAFKPSRSATGPNWFDIIALFYFSETGHQTQRVGNMNNIAQDTAIFAGFGVVVPLNGINKLGRKRPFVQNLTANFSMVRFPIPWIRPHQGLFPSSPWFRFALNLFLQSCQGSVCRHHAAGPL